MKILFFSNAVTLAHFARPISLAHALLDTEYELHFAVPPRYHEKNNRIVFYDLDVMSPELFLKRLERGAPLFDKKILRKNINDDLALIDLVKPDLIIGDFRLSLNISAKLRNIPFVNVASAYWDPSVDIDYVPMPNHWTNKIFGRRFNNYIFNLLYDYFLKHHIKGYNKIVKEYEVEPFSSYEEFFTSGDYTLYSDAHELVPLKNLSEKKVMLGPILWAPDVPKPNWWDEIREDKGRIIYFSCGSSGNISQISKILNALSKSAYQVLFADMGQKCYVNSDNIYKANLLNGIEAAEISELVICNGGTLSCYQALSAGKPVIGIASNLDQFLSMKFIKDKGLGICLPSDTFSEKDLLEAIDRLINNAESRQKCEAFSQELKKYDSAAIFRDFIESVEVKLAI